MRTFFDNIQPVVVTVLSREELGPDLLKDA